MAFVNFKNSLAYTIVNNVAIFPENTEEIEIEWSLNGVSTPEGFGSIDYYWVTLESSNGHYVYTRAKNVRDTYINFNVMDYANRYSGNNYEFRFTVCAFDIYGKRSSDVSSTYTFKFNSFSVGTASLNLSNKIYYSTSNYNINLSINGSPKNLNNNTNYTKEISTSIKIDPYYYCEIHNPQYALTNNKIVVVGINGTAPTDEAYITLKEIRENMFSTAENSTGYISVSLTNNYGSTVSISKSIIINLPYMPANASNITINTNKTVSGTRYYVSGYPVTINFTAGKDQYGIKTPTHYFYYAIVDVGTGEPDESQFICSYAYSGFKLDIPAQNKQKQMYYKLETRLNNISSFTNVESIILDYYYRPSVAITHINRDETRLTFKVEISKNSSIPEGTLRITGVTYNYLYESTDYTYNASIPTDATSTHTTWNATLDLTRGSSTDEAKEKAKAAKWLMYVKVYDTFLGTSDPTIRTTQIYAYIPVMTFTKYGVGINYIPEYKDKNYKLTVGGVSQFKENSHFTNGISIHKKLDLYDLYPERGELNLKNYSDYMGALQSGRLNTDTKIRFFNNDSSTNNSYDYSADIYVKNDRLAIDYTDVNGSRVTEKFVTFNDLVTNSTSAYTSSSQLNSTEIEAIVIKTGSYYYKTCTIKVPISEFEFNNDTNVFKLVSGSDSNSNYVHYLNPNVYAYRNGDSYGYIRAIFRSDRLPVVTATVESSDENIVHTVKLRQDGTVYKMPSIMVHINKLNNNHGYINDGYVNIVAQGCCDLIDIAGTSGDGTIISRSNTLYYIDPSAYVKDKYGV